MQIVVLEKSSSRTRFAPTLRKLGDDWHGLCRKIEKVCDRRLNFLLPLLTMKPVDIHLMEGFCSRSVVFKCHSVTSRGTGSTSSSSACFPRCHTSFFASDHTILLNKQCIHNYIYIVACLSWRLLTNFTIGRHNKNCKFLTKRIFATISPQRLIYHHCIHV